MKCSVQTKPEQYKAPLIIDIEPVTVVIGGAGQNNSPVDGHDEEEEGDD